MSQKSNRVLFAEITTENKQHKMPLQLFWKPRTVWWVMLVPVSPLIPFSGRERVAVMPANKESDVDSKAVTRYSLFRRCYWEKTQCPGVLGHPEGLGEGFMSLPCFSPFTLSFYFPLLQLLVIACSLSFCRREEDRKPSKELWLLVVIDVFCGCFIRTTKKII